MRRRQFDCADDHVLAPVICEPALPFAAPWALESKTSLGLDEDELSALRKRLSELLEVAAFRFKGIHLFPRPEGWFLEAPVSESYGKKMRGDRNLGRMCPNAHSVFTNDFDPSRPSSHWAFQILVPFFEGKPA